MMTMITVVMLVGLVCFLFFFPFFFKEKKLDLLKKKILCFIFIEFYQVGVIGMQNKKKKQTPKACSSIATNQLEHISEDFKYPLKEQIFPFEERLQIKNQFHVMISLYAGIKIKSCNLYLLQYFVIKRKTY